eukprot:m.10800 g.10800  ORF g.10800 m.10800 type:complete len:92 (+) comp5618_c0_seq1:1997-2272(+)
MYYLRYERELLQVRCIFSVLCVCVLRTLFNRKVFFSLFLKPCANETPIDVAIHIQARAQKRIPTKNFNSVTQVKLQQRNTPLRNVQLHTQI